MDSQIEAGIRRAVQQIQDNPQLGRQPFELRVIDMPRPWQDTGSQLARVLFENRMTALIGPTRGKDAHVAAQIATRARIPLITVASEDNLTEVGAPWIFRGIPSDFEQAHYLLSWALREVQTSTAYAVVSEGRDGREQRRSLTKASQAMGLKLTFGRSLEELNKAKPLVVLFWTEAAEVARWIGQLDEHSGPRFLLGPLRLIQPQVIAATRRSGLSIHVPYLGDCHAGENKEESNMWETLGFELATAIAQAASGKATSSDAVRAALMSQKAISGGTGDLKFDPRGRRVGDLNVAVIRGGRLICGAHGDLR